MPLATPDHLTHADLTQAARVLLWRYQDGTPIGWQRERIYGNDNLRARFDRNPEARFVSDYAQEVLLAFYPDLAPKHVIRRLSLMGLQAGMTGRGPSHPECSDEDLLAGLHLLHQRHWFVHMAAERMAPTWVLHLIAVLGAETVNLAISLGMNRDWFTSAAEQPETVDLPALRTLAALSGATPEATGADVLHDVLDLVDSGSMPTGSMPTGGTP